MAVPVVCTRPTPPLSATIQPQASNQQPIVLLPSLTENVPVISTPQYIEDFPLSRISVRYFLATLCRAVYAPTDAPIKSAIYSVLPSDTPVFFVPNTATTPAYCIIVLPHCGICVIGGTTTLTQWLIQVFYGVLVNTNFPFSNGDNGQTMILYQSNANVILADLAVRLPDNRPILFTGHSMGGAIAHVCHYRFQPTRQTTRRPSRVMSFACPKPGNHVLASQQRNGPAVFRRYFLLGDLVPGLPPAILPVQPNVIPQLFAVPAAQWASYEQPGAPQSIDSNGNVLNAGEVDMPLAFSGAALAAFAGNPIAIALAHFPRTIVSYIRAGFGTALPTAEVSTWQNPQNLDVVNVTLNNLGL